MALLRKRTTDQPQFEGPALQLAPAGPAQVQRGIRLPQLLISLLVVGVFGLLGLWWAASTAAREPVVGLASDISQGQVLGREDLITVYVSSDGGVIASTPADFIDAFVGKVAKTDFEAGTLVTGSMFQTTEPLGPGEAFVGLELPNNHFPSSLSPGDAVHVLILGNDVDESEPSFDEPATVETVASDRQGRTRIRIRMDSAESFEVQRSAASDDVVLVEVQAVGEPGE